ncbi:MAG: helix-turn-helix domain-containing protein [Thermacetogeniaceae bacterium]
MDLRGLGYRIRRLRLQQGLTLEQLAERAGVNKTFICDVETGRSLLSLRSLAAIAKALNSSPGYILGESDADNQLDSKYSGKIKEFLLEEDSLPYIAFAQYLKSKYTPDELRVIQTILGDNRFKKLIASLVPPPPEKYLDLVQEFLRKIQ